MMPHHFLITKKLKKHIWAVNLQKKKEQKMNSSEIVPLNKKTRTVKKIIIIILTVFIFLNFLPYLLPVSEKEACMTNLPFGESRIDEVDNVLIHSRVWIPKGYIKGKILMIHGLGGSTFSWLKSVESLLDAGFMVVAADLPGFGYSDRTPGLDHSQKTRSKLLWEVVEKIEIELEELTVIADSNMEENERGLEKQGKILDFKWNLVGHSMGGGTVAAMGMEKPEKTASLIFVAGAVFDNNPGRGNILFKYPPVQRWVKVILHNYAIHPERISSFLESAYGREPYDYEVTGYLNPLKQSGTSNTMIDMIKTAKNEPIENLAGTKIPILGVWGEDDSWVPKSEGERLIGILPKMQLEIIEEAAHCPMETHPEEFNSIILKFLNEIS